MKINLRGKYGYKCYEQIEDSAYTEIRWKNHITGMSFDQSFAFSRRLNEKNHKSNKFKIAGFGYAWFKSLGVSSTDLMTLSRAEIYQKYNIQFLLENKKQQYRIQLTKLITE